MDVVDKVLHLLRLASGTLGYSGHMYKEIDGLDRKQTIRKIGGWIGELKDFEDKICDLYPDKTSDSWRLIQEDKIAYDKEYEDLYEAMNMEDKGNVEKAIELYKSIELNSKIEQNVTWAQAGLYRLMCNITSDYGVNH
jgi:hypothetical protein